MNHTLITNDVIKEYVPSGRNRYDSWKTEEQREKRCLYRAVGSYSIVKYRILCILNYRPFGKGKCNKCLL